MVRSVTLSTNAMRFVALAVCLTIAGACARARMPDLEPGERRAFHASSVDKEFFIRGEFDGVAEIWKDSILVQVTRGRIDTRGRKDDGVVLRAALASGDTAGRWRLGDASSAAPVPGIRRDDAGRWSSRCDSPSSAPRSDLENTGWCSCSRPRAASGRRMAGHFCTRRSPTANATSSPRRRTWSKRSPEGFATVSSGNPRRPARYASRSRRGPARRHR